MEVLEVPVQRVQLITAEVPRPAVVEEALSSNTSRAHTPPKSPRPPDLAPQSVADGALPGEDARQSSIKAAIACRRISAVSGCDAARW